MLISVLCLMHFADLIDLPLSGFQSALLLDIMAAGDQRRLTGRGAV